MIIGSSARTLWGAGFGECTTCSTSGDPVWTCPATLSAYADIGGTGADIVEVDGATGKPAVSICISIVLDQS